MKKTNLAQRLGSFMEMWLSNPGAQLDFVRLVEAVHQQPRRDHADHELLDWIDEQRSGLKSIGIR